MRERWSCTRNCCGWWGPNSESQSQYLRVYITHLRKKLESPGGGKSIQTEPGIGYRLLASE